MSHSKRDTNYIVRLIIDADSRVLKRESLNDVPGAMVESHTCMLEDRWCAQWNCLDLFGMMPCRIFAAKVAVLLS